MPASTPDHTALYRFYDADGQLLYVGISCEPEQRWRSHRRDRRETWWPQIAEKEVEWFASRREAASAEKKAIKTEKPLHNVMHTPRALKPDKELRFGEVSFALAQAAFGDHPFTSADLHSVSKQSKAAIEQHVRALRKKGQLIPVGRRSNAPRVGKRHVLYVVAGSPLADVSEPILQGGGTDGVCAATGLTLATLERARERFGATPFTIAELVAASDCSKPSVYRCVVTLEQRGLLVVIGKRNRTGIQGRDPKLLQVA